MLRRILDSVFFISTPAGKPLGFGRVELGLPAGHAPQPRIAPSAQRADSRNTDQPEPSDHEARLGASHASATHRSGLPRERSERLGPASAASYTPPRAQRATPPVNHHRPLPPPATTRRKESLTPASHRNAALSRQRGIRSWQATPCQLGPELTSAGESGRSS